jgi:hypothetical protein
MGGDEAKPNAANSNAESPWEELASGRPKPGEPDPRASRLPRAIRLLPGIALLLLLGAGAWLGWRALHLERRGGASNSAVTTDQSCEKVTRILRELPMTKEGIEAATAQIREETTRIEGRTDALKRDEREWARLGLVIGDLRKARAGLRGRLEPFTERDVIKGSAPPPGASSSIAELERATKGFVVVSGPGPDLLAAVERYEAACQKLLELRRPEGGEGGATWGR